MNNNINFKNIGILLQAVTKTSEENLYDFTTLNYYLSTGDLKCFSPKVRMSLITMNYKKLLIDVQATLLLHDSIKDLTNSNLVRMYKSDYWDVLYSSLPDPNSNCNEFIKKYKENFNKIVMSDSKDYSIIMYSFLNDTLIYMNNIIAKESSSNSDKYLEYQKAMILPNLISQEKGKPNLSLVKKIKNYKR